VEPGGASEARLVAHEVRAEDGDEIPAGVVVVVVGAPDIAILHVPSAVGAAVGLLESEVPGVRYAEGDGIIPRRRAVAEVHAASQRRSRKADSVCIPPRWFECRRAGCPTRRLSESGQTHAYRLGTARRLAGRRDGTWSCSPPAASRARSCWKTQPCEGQRNAMNVPTSPAVAQSSLSLPRRLVRNVLRRPAVLVAATLWIVANVAVVVLADGRLPFDRPALAGMPFAQQVALPSVGLIEVFVLMTVVYFLTRRRVIPDLAARAPERSLAARETAALLGYAPLGSPRRRTGRRSRTCAASSY
jgi:hypothetical protein